MSHPPLHTTGRLASRLTMAEINAIKADLTSYAPPAPFFKTPPQNLEVELGMGNGLAMLERAHANPAGTFLGTELYLNGLETLLRHLKQKPAQNLYVLNEDARELLQKFPKDSVSRILLPFPDPWPKAKHHKRRILQNELLDDATRILKPGGEFWLITDWPSYAFHGLSLLSQHKTLVLDQTGNAAADCKPAARLKEEQDETAALGPHLLAQAPLWWVPTKYQQKAALAGRAPWFIRAVKP